MFAKGYRPAGPNQHIAVVKFASQFLEENDALLFDRMRRKRHHSVYDTAGSISEKEADAAITSAEQLIGKIEDLLRASTP
jgi:uncharacterized protein (UPF0332 family)